MNLRKLIIICVQIMEITTRENKCKPLKHWITSSYPMFYVDTFWREKSCPTDTFFDRLVAVHTNIKEKGWKKITLATGVLITEDLVLTSFNAFRIMSSRNNTLKDINLYWLLTRYIEDDGTVSNVRYDWIPSNQRGYAILCARQVVPDFDTELPSDMRHGPHSPLHDLMVIRFYYEIFTFFPHPIPPRVFTFKGYPKMRSRWETDFLSPIRTVLARKDDEIGNEIYFASLGHRNEKHIKTHRYLERVIYNNVKDKVLADCEEWLPRRWGHFICINNVDNFAGIASGAMLFSDEKLFGVGSFALFKGTKSVLVFTDVRPYWHLFYRTCTKDDQNLKIPRPDPPAKSTSETETDSD